MAPKDDSIMNGRVSKLETQYDSINEKLATLITNSTVKIQQVESTGAANVIEYNHRLAALTDKIADLQKWQKILVGVVIVLALAVGGGTGTTVMTALAKGGLVP